MIGRRCRFRCCARQRLTRYFAAIAGEIEPGVLPAEWLPTPVPTPAGG